MDNITAPVLAVGLLALAGIAFFAVFRKRGNLTIKGPGGISLEAHGSNDPAPTQSAVRVTDAKSRAGGITAADTTGRGAEVSRVEVERDINVSSQPPNPPPKV
jgi:hypothetical protein